MFNKGYDPRRAKGGYRPGAGRKPDEFYIWIKNLVHSPEARARFEKILKDAPDADVYVDADGNMTMVRAKADTYMRALEVGLNYAEGKPVTRIETGHLEKINISPEDSKRNAEKIYQGLKKLEEDALNSRPSTPH